MEMAILVLTVLLSAAAAGFTTYFLNVSKERRSFHGSKAEELYRATEALDAELSTYFARSYSLHATGSSGSSPVELERAAAGLMTVKMLVGFYFPMLSGALTRVIAASTTAHRGLVAYQQMSGVAGKQALEALDTSVCELKDALETLKTGILTEGRARTRVGQRRRRSEARSRVLEIPA